MTEVRIDAEFRALIPPLTADEYALLESGILADGCRDALVVWADTADCPECGEACFCEGDVPCPHCGSVFEYPTPVLADGHNRYEICTKHGIAYQTTDLRRESRDEVKAWIIQNQFGRRNLQPFQRAELALLLEPIFRQKGKENQGERTDLLQKSAKSDKPVDTRKELAKVAGVSHDTISKAKKIIEKADEKTKGLLRSGEISVNAAYRNIEREEVKDLQKQRRLDPVALPVGEYDVIYADPPWFYDFAPHSNINIENHYPTMQTDDICAMEIPAAKNAVLFLWATSPKLLEALRVMDAWGFTYKTHAVWDKESPTSLSMGYWFRGQHELLLVGTKGQISPPQSENRFVSVIREKKTRHSKKPDCAYTMIETMMPGRQYLELFARNERDNWQSWGNQA